MQNIFNLITAENQLAGVILIAVLMLPHLIVFVSSFFLGAYKSMPASGLVVSVIIGIGLISINYGVNHEISMHPGYVYVLGSLGTMLNLHLLQAYDDWSDAANWS